jgi:hypothetical protein
LTGCRRPVTVIFQRTAPVHGNFREPGQPFDFQRRGSTDRAGMAPRWWHFLEARLMPSATPVATAGFMVDAAANHQRPFAAAVTVDVGLLTVQ